MQRTIALCSLITALALGTLPACGCGDQPATDGDGGRPKPVTTDAGHDARVATGDSGVHGVADPNNPNNDALDTDCDGLNDQEEFGNTYGGGRQTSPDNPDSDGDGIADGVELGRASSVDPLCASFTGDADSSSHTDPTRPDTDGDGLCDGNGTLADGCVSGEDLNNNGAYEVGTELDPRHPDTDHDGRCDGANTVGSVCQGGDPNPHLAVPDTDNDGIPDSVEDSVAGLDKTNPDSDGDGLCDGPRSVDGVCVGGEDANGDGVVSAGETDPTHQDTDCDGVGDKEERDLGLNPRKRDSDGDLILDGVERCQTQNLDSAFCTSFVAAVEPCSNTNPKLVDSDADGINDGVEDANRNGHQDTGETNPMGPDSDGDQLCDGPPQVVAAVCSGGEDLNGNGRLDVGETDPRVAGTAAADADHDGIPDDFDAAPSNPDRDGDGLCDGPLAVAGSCAAGEDLNHNGRVDVGETDPAKTDSDCDGLVDGAGFTAGANVYKGEKDLVTSPTNPDTDGDGLSDGLEAGVAGTSVPAGTSAVCGFTPDSNPGTTSNPLRADSDNDGIPDGAEDANQNGGVDTGELDPNLADASGPILAACGVTALVALDYGQTVQPDQLFATANYGGNDAFSERTTLKQGTDERGLMFYNPTHDVAAFVVTITPAAGDTTAGTAEQARRATLGGLTAPFTRTFTTWDGYAQSVLATYDDATAGTVKGRANDIVKKLLGGANPDGQLSAGGGNSPFKLALEYVRRSDQRLVIVGALTRAANFSGVPQFRLEDLGNGSALAQFGDSVGTQCDVFDAQNNAKVDFLWVIDNSGSMLDEQQTVADTATEMTTQLGGSTLDWRLAVVTTDLEYYDAAGWGPYVWQSGTSYPTACDYDNAPVWNACGQPVYCSFTTNAAAFASCVDSLYICGVGVESAFAPFACVMGGQVAGQRWCNSQTGWTTPPPAYGMLPAANGSATKVRPGATLAVIMMTDEPEQSADIADPPLTTTIAQWVDYFSNYDGAGSKAFVAGILCPPGQRCSCTGNTLCAVSDSRYRDFVQAMNGVEGDISTPATIPGTLTQILAAVAGNASPYALSKPPISSTIKVATSAATSGACNVNDIPRSREHGWDYDGATGNIVFYGNCRPQAGANAKIAVSYRYWVDRTAPAGPPATCNCTPPMQCNPNTMQCYCPPDCGLGAAVPAEKVCDTATCQLTCRPDCGAGCGGNSMCNAAENVCACECPGDCGGPAPSMGSVCDRVPSSATYCTYVCPAPGAPPAGKHWDAQSCSWACDACATCTGLATCNPNSCACECSQSLTCGAGFRWDSSACDCVCDTASLGCSGAYQADSALCGCTCRANCGDTCEGGTYCNESRCACVPQGG